MDPTRAVRNERDFAFALLSLAQSRNPQLMLSAALDALVRVTGALQGYVELRDDDEPLLAWHAVEGFAESDVARIRETFSSGIMAEAIARGDILHTMLANQDTRFSDFESVRANSIEAVLCAPLECAGLGGVVYLQGRVTAASYDERDLAHVAFFQRAVSGLASTLVTSARKDRAEDRLAAEWRTPELVARSSSMQTMLASLAGAAALDIPISLTGASGVGKSMLAAAIHRRSARGAGPFVEINCASLPDTLFENEMFGSEPGAHSTATKGSIGKVGAAHGGTLFLDEVTELSRAAQAKLLQFLQSGTYYRLGAVGASHADVRLITATNQDVRALVRDGRFREDLLYRIAVMTFHVPSLSERIEDVVPIALQVVRRVTEKHGFGARPLSERARAALLAAEWPGNVRQLAHAVEAGAVRAHVASSRQIEAEHLFEHTEGANEPLTLQTQLERFKRGVVQAALEESDWNVSQAARRLDVARSYLYSLIQAHGLRRAG